MNSRDSFSQNTLDHKLIHGPLKTHVLATSQRLRQESQQDRLPQLSEFILKIADNNYDAIRCLVMQSYKYASAANVICRSTMDLIFMLCLIFSNRQKYLNMYFKSGWREKFEELQDQKKSSYMLTNGMDWIAKYEEYIEINI